MSNPNLMDGTPEMSKASNRILARKQARADAQQIRALCSWPDGTGADYAISLLKELETLLPKKKEAKQKEVDRKSLAKSIGFQFIPFGAHTGVPIKDIPLGYLQWLCSSSEEMANNLKLYLKEERQ